MMKASDTVKNILNPRYSLYACFAIKSRILIWFFCVKIWYPGSLSENQRVYYH